MNRPNLDNIINNYRKFHRDNKDGEELIQKAYVYAVFKHGKQERKSGEPYINHPLEVAYTVSEMGMDAISIASAFLHDVVEDTDTSREEIEINFGKNVSNLVDGLTKLKRNSSARKERSFLKLTKVFTEDDRAMVIKLADRLHNMKTLTGIKNKDKRRRIAKETLEIFAPFALKIGIRYISDELFDLSLKYFDPKGYNTILKHFSGTKNELAPHLESVVRNIKKELLNNNLNVKLYTNYKSIYDIYSSIKNDNKVIDVTNITEHIYNSSDFFSVEIITKNIEEIFKILYLLHKNFNYLPSAIEDHINSQEFSGNRFLKTVLFTQDGDRNNIFFEVKIRTEEMYKVYREGLTVVYKYEDVPSLRDTKYVEELKENIKKQFEEYDENKGNSVFEKYESVKSAATTKFISVLTLKRNKYMRIPEGSTLIDLAYHINPHLGDYFKMARVNGEEITDPAYVLREKDNVLIWTGDKFRVNSTWLSFAKTQRAKDAIKRAVRKNLIERGEKILKEELEKNKIEYEGFKEWVLKNKKNIGYFFGRINDIKNLFYIIGVDSVHAKDVIFIYEKYRKEDIGELAGSDGKNKEGNVAYIFSKIYKNIKFLKKKKNIPIIQLDESFLKFYPFCPYCKPIRGEDAFLIKRDEEFEIHSKKCEIYQNWCGEKSVENGEAEELEVNLKRKKIVWPKGNLKENRFRVKLLITAKDREELLKELTKVISRKGVNISKNLASVKISPQKEGEETLAEVYLLIDIDGISELTNVLKEIRNFKEIMEIKHERKGYVLISG